MNWRLMLIMVGGGIALAIYGGRELSLGWSASSEPEPITLETLEEGMPANPHRRLGPHIALYDLLVYSERVRRGNSTLNHAYYPVVSEKLLHETMKKMNPDAVRLGGPGAIYQALPIKVIIKTRRWSTKEELQTNLKGADDLVKTDTVGTIINRIDSLGEKEANLIRESTGGKRDPANLIIFEEGRAPSNRYLAILLLAAGVGLAITPGIVWLVRRRETTPADDDSGTPAQP